MSATTPDPGRRYLNLPSRSLPLPFSDAVQVGNTLYLSGRIGIDPATGRVPEDVDQELKLMFDGFQAVLNQAGMTFDDLVSVQVFSSDLSLWDRFNTEYLKRFSKDRLPARAFLGSALLLGGRFEIMGIAVKAGN
jgi:2-iminobutanoate/2-iminopropanoate deaminase